MASSAVIVDLASAREQRMPHVCGPALCLICQHMWEAVAPLGTRWLECPQCHRMQGLLTYPLRLSNGRCS